MVLLAVLMPPAHTHAASSTLDPVRRAKVALSWFLLDHIDRPLHITEPCPTITADSVAANLVSLGLIPSSRESGVAVVVDDEIGRGVPILRCGVDIARSAQPAGATALAIDVLMLDGRATFDQLAVEIGGDEVVVGSIDGLRGESAGRCTNSGRRCTWALNMGGLVLVLRATGLPAETGEGQIVQLLRTLAPEVVSNLAERAIT